MLLYVLGILIALGYASELWRRRRTGAGWQRELNFVVDLLAMSAVILVVGVLAIMQLTNDPAATPSHPTPGGEIAGNVNPNPGGMTTSADEMVPDPTIAGEELPPDGEGATDPGEAGEPTGAATATPPSPDASDEPQATATRRTTRTPRATTATAASTSVEGTATPRTSPTSRATATEPATPTEAATATPEPTATEAATPTVAPTATAVPTTPPPPPPTAAPAPTRRTHTVRAGDNLLAIAVQYDVSVEAILAANPGLVPEQLQIGQVIVIPPTGSAPAAPAPTTQNYTVREGDTLGAIANRFGTTTAELIRLNPSINPDSLQIGTVLRVPL